MMMLLPFQKFIFEAAPPPAELQRKLILMLEQKGGFPGRKPPTLRKGKDRSPWFTGTMEGDRFEVISCKSNGDEDLVKVSGRIIPEKDQLKVEVTLKVTGAWLTNLAAGVVIALVAAFMYGYIGEKWYELVQASSWMPYLILLATSFWINLRRYSNRAQALLEQLVYWLELEDSL